MNLDHLKPRHADVLVGETTMRIAPSTLVQQTEIARTLKSVDVHALAKAAAPIVEQAGGAGFVGALTAHLGDIVEAIVLTITESALPALTGAVAASLDTAHNYKALAALRAQDSDGGLTDARHEHGCYLGSESLRAWVAHTITLDQALHVVRQAIELNNLDAMGKALLGAVMAVEVPTPPTPTETETETAVS